MNLRLLTINALDEISGLSASATRIRRTMDGAHWSTPHHVFGETIVVGMSEADSYHDYKYKTEFQIWKENRDLSAKTF